MDYNSLQIIVLHVQAVHGSPLTVSPRLLPMSGDLVRIEQLGDLRPQAEELSARDRKAVLIEFARTVPGDITTDVHRAVAQAISDGRLPPGEVPHPTTLFRWLRGNKASEERLAAVRGGVAHPRARTGGDSLASVAPPFATPAQRLKDATNRLHRAAARLHALGVFGDRVRDHGALLKRLGRVNTSHMDAVEALLEEAESRIAQFEREAAAREVDAAPEGPTTSVAAVPPLAPFQTSRRMPVYDDPPNPAARFPLASQSPESSIALGEKVGELRPSRSTQVAEVRARLVAPILNGVMTPEACADAWRRAFRGADSGDVAVVAAGIPRELQLKYRNVHATTLWRWAERIRKARRVDDRATARDVLRHTNHSNARRHRKLTPDMIEAARRYFLENANWHKSLVAQRIREEFDVEISDRRVQQILDAVISNRERALARGGADAADVLQRIRLIREAPYPNRAWIMDHSFLAQEYVDVNAVDQVFDFDFEFAFRVQTGDGWKRSYGLHMTRIIDACTRRTMATRLWAGAPTTRMTLLAVRDAIQRFGVPEIMYTDNGSDFQSAEMQQAMQAVGITQVFSRPYTPQGRGKLERQFLYIKQSILAAMPGFAGGRHGADDQWADEDLLTLEELEARVQDGIERLFDQRKHSETKRLPAEHYDAEVHARVLRGHDRLLATPTGLLSLMLDEGPLRLHADGIRFKGARYYSPAFASTLSIGASVYVRFDPTRPSTIHVLAPAPGGDLVYIGEAERYTNAEPPPSFLEQQRLEAEFRRENRLDAQSREEHRSNRERAARHKARGRQISASVSIADEPETPMATPALDAPRPVKALGPGRTTVPARTTPELHAPAKSITNEVLPAAEPPPKPKARRDPTAAIGRMPWDID